MNNKPVRQYGWLGAVLLATLPVGGCYPAASTSAKPAASAARPEDAPAALSALPLFRDMTGESGVACTYRNGEEAGHYTLLESLGGGVALLDYDRDGLLDLFVPCGGYFDGPDKKEIKGYPSKLYKNLGGWKFRDVTAEAGVDRPVFYTHGAAVADYDNDGWPDLLVTGWGRLVLYHNEPVDPQDPRKGRRFCDVTRQAGLTDTLWSTSAAWADLDRDGFPDLYVCHYLNWSFDNHPRCAAGKSGAEKDICSPKVFLGLPHTLYRNNGDGTFSDVSAAAGIRQGDSREGKGLGVLVVDVNDDRRPDVYVANDTSGNFLYLNRSAPRKLSFKEVGLASGVSRNEHGFPQASMGVDAADYNGSGRPALWVTNYENELHALYRNQGGGRFRFSTSAAGIAAIGQRYVGFGTAFVDVDNDGWEDLVVVNGHVLRHSATAGLRQRPVLLRNLGTKQFADITREGGPYFRADHLGRGLAVGDLDNDGWPDLIVSHLNEPIVLLRNEAKEAAGNRHWMGIELTGTRNRDVVGAKVIVEAAGRRLTRFAKGGGSYLSSGDRRLLFGLGTANRIDRLTVIWPSGCEQQWNGDQLPVDLYHRARE